jgi:hypothetical protein
MPQIAAILKDPQKGLLPYLERTLAVNWGRFQLRNWAFLDTEENNSGFRLRESTTQQLQFDLVLKSWTITLGKVITIDDPLDSQLFGGAFSEDIDNAILHWANGVCPWMETFDGNVSPIQRISGMNDIEQNTRISSENDGAWNIVVVREFEIFYHLDYEAC